LWEPLASNTIDRAEAIVARPCVIARRGTSAIRPSKNLALSQRVSSVSVTTCVGESNAEPGSLNARWPLPPIPRICTSTPPIAAIRATNAASSDTKTPSARSISPARDHRAGGGHTEPLGVDFHDAR
jgi:hypothetical protein